MFRSKVAPTIAALTICSIYMLFLIVEIPFDSTLSYKTITKLISINHLDKPKGVLVSLCRNSDLHAMKKLVRNMNDRFNNKFNYPWLLLNDKPFNDNFKNQLKSLTNQTLIFGQIPIEHWSYPQWIDQNKAAKTRIDMKDVIYGGSESYRHMCRFNSGFVWKHPLMKEYDFYWRVEPGNVEYYCEMQDKFEEAKINDYKYGFNIAMIEYQATIPTLWETVKAFMRKYPHLIPKNNALDLVTDNNGKTYNGCHFWSNFEIVNLDFYRSEAYETFFNYLDHAGGFFYERWGDAPVHSIAAAMFLNISQIHFFEDIGYRHDLFENCPLDSETSGKCVCELDKSHNKHGLNTGNVCMRKYYQLRKDNNLPN